MADKKKILIFSGQMRGGYRWGLFAEMLNRLIEDENNEVYVLSCHKAISTICWTDKRKLFGYCRRCYPVCEKIAAELKSPQIKLLTMKKYKAPKFPKFETLEEALEFSYEGYQYGVGPVSSCMSISRDYNFDIKIHQKNIQSMMQTEYIMIKNLEELDQIYNFDEIWTFNGRAPIAYACLSYCRKHNKHTGLWEVAANDKKILVLKDLIIHEVEDFKKRVQICWENATEDKYEIAAKWFTDRRAGKRQQIDSFTKDQLKGSLPDGFDFDRENIAFFNSSIDEIYAFKSWVHPVFGFGEDLIRKVLEHFKDDANKHFYLRVHPNLRSAKKNNTSQMQEIAELKKLYKNLTVIEPDEKIDTYALMEACDKIVVCNSTIGCESTFWGKVAISAGKSPYEDLDAAYNPADYEELYKLIADKNLPPKAKENSCIYGYFLAVMGEDNKYFKVDSFGKGTFNNFTVNKRDLFLGDKKIF
ncbi:MAG: hypothetical protein IJW31_05675 [Lentisphaeria bacterium]|nr:hypothetical protein [Lentisphaeria bacterium]